MADVTSEPPQSNGISLHGIASDICHRQKIPLHALRSERKTRRLTTPRLEFYYRAFVARRWSTTVIGRWCGGRNHSTVIWGIRRHCQQHGLPSPLKIDRAC
jgi:chromosomal replication initiation ATPase DnaA